jgi:hypothetical protein
LKIRLTLAGLVVALAAASSTALATHVPGAPANDDYLQSFQLNKPGTRLERRATLRDPAPGQARSTANASIQQDIFSPNASGAPGGGGPAEVTTCSGKTYGKTVWYDFYPDVQGTARIRANGYDTAISVIPFNPRTGVPDFARRFCVNASSSTQEEALAEVAARRAYTVQIGGVGGASGNLEFLFDFLADTDRDRIFDDTDKCDLRAGRTKTGCVRIKPSLSARPTDDGIEIASLRVTAPRGFKVSVRCRGCPAQAKRAKAVGFKRLRGRRLRAGTSLVIRATKRNNIGAYFRYRISRGNFSRPPRERCLNPGSKKPRRRCSY